MSIFLTLLVPKLPTPKEKDLSKGVLDAIDFDSHRAEKKKEKSISLSDEEGIVKPSSFGVGAINKVELDSLDNIVKEFNDIFGNIAWQHKDNVVGLIKNMPNMIIENQKVVNAIQNSSKQNAKIEFENAFINAAVAIMNDSMELFKQINQDEIFNKWLSDNIFKIVYNKVKNGADDEHLNYAAFEREESVAFEYSGKIKD